MNPMALASAAFQAVQTAGSSGSTSAFRAQTPLQSPLQSPLDGNSALGPTGVLASSLASGPSTPAPFAGLFTDAVASINQLQDQAGAAVEGLMTGSGIDVHQAMIATEKADMAFELALAVRNKAVQAAQQVMSMQF